METDGLRTWGLVAGAAALSALLTIAVLAGCGQSAPSPSPPAVQTPAPPAAADAQDPSDAFEAAGADAPPPAQPALQIPEFGARPSFLIRFEAPHPMARAQTLAAQSDMRAARGAALAGLRARRELDGLCFDRFTLGGAEIVLTACSDVANPDAFVRRWTRRLQAMPGVTYAEPNRSAQPDARR